jgi:hypothetical protein
MLKRVEVPDRLPVPIQDYNGVSHDIDRKTSVIALRAGRKNLFYVDKHRHVVIRQSLNGIVVKCAEAGRADRRRAGKHIARP